MKVIFLDIDGVLVTKQSILANRHIHPHDFDKDCVNVLNHILFETGAKIVISSTWRLFWNMSELKEHFSKFGIDPDVIIDITPDFNQSMARGLEIAWWLRNHSEVEDFVIIDDDNDMHHLSLFLVQTNMDGGLRASHIEYILDMIGD